MPELEQLIAEWRASMNASSHASRETLDELENHLREEVEKLLRSGLSETEAFQRAVAKLGSPATLAGEFEKLRGASWLPVKLVAGIGIAGALVLFIMIIPSLAGQQWSWLLGAHVFTITLGYSATLLLGTLGICFVAQRSVSSFSSLRADALSRASLAFAWTAAGLTAAGVLLGMLWTRGAWGRYWDWDPKEIGGLCVLIWLAGYIAAHRVRWATAHGILALSVFGNVVVLLAWFEPNRLAGLHSYGSSSFSAVVMAVVLFHLAMFFVGLAPAGWLRLSRA